MSRSTTSDSLPSPSTVCSQTGDGNPVLSPDPTTETVRSRPHRGRRKGPLDLETRTKTAFKRKFKLTCAFHRAKRTSCNCHDFSKLEEGYHRYLATEAQKGKASQGPLVRAFGDDGTLGIGGAGDTAPAAFPRYQNVDLPELPLGPELPPYMHLNLLPVLKFDIHSAASVTAIVSARHEDPFFLDPEAPLPISDSVPIGCSMLSFRNRWECKYRCATEETGSLTSTDSCPWTGPFEQLSNHFSNQHHPFQPADIPCCSICMQCSAMSPKWVEERACPDPDKCDPSSWRRWFFGTTPRPPNPNRRRLTVSEASGSRSSWMDPSWNMTTPGSSNTEQSNIPYASYTDKSAFYEHSTSGNENNEVGDGERKNAAYHACEGRQNCCPYQSNPGDLIRHCCIRSRLPSPRCMMGPGSVIYHTHLSLARPSRSYRRLVLPLLALLVVFRARAERDLVDLGIALLALLAGSYCLRWYLALAILGPLVAWAVVCSLRIRTSREDGLHALASVV